MNGIKDETYCHSMFFWERERERESGWIEASTRIGKDEEKAEEFDKFFRYVLQERGGKEGKIQHEHVCWDEEEEQA